MQPVPQPQARPATLALPFGIQPRQAKVRLSLSPGSGIWLSESYGRRARLRRLGGGGGGGSTREAWHAIVDETFV